jgi:hypothetical protein
MNLALTESKNVGRLVVSAIIVTILSLQAVVGFVNTGMRAWPLVAYPMYKTARYEGDRLDHALNAYAILANGEKVPITPDDLNMSFWLFGDHFIAPVINGRRDVLEPLIARYCEHHGSQVVAFRIEDTGTAIGRDGPVEGLPPETWGELAVTCP